MTKSGTRRFAQKARGLLHLSFCIDLYREQHKHGRYFLHEHPWPAWSWRLPGMQALMATPSVTLGKGHMCRHGMFIDTPTGKKLALKATGFLSNSKHIIDVLAKRCLNNRVQGIMNMPACRMADRGKRRFGRRSFTSPY